ncbi:hypothetical protein VL10_18365 [Leclercia adecarboxylata]|nr:hypothetical protein VL10_18365 [Leclercia adecarboxylata]KMN63317.1 hypothetical protein VK95_19855 [Leclercia sp. LK8]
MAKFKIGDRVAHATNEGPDMIVISEFMSQNSELNRPDLQAYDCEFWSEVKGEFVIHRFLETSIQESQRS